MKVSKSGLFLFELIVVIFLFTISTAICISIFAKSYSFSTDSENLTISSLKAQTAAEIFKNTDEDGGLTSDAISEALGEGGGGSVLTGNDDPYGAFVLSLYYDEEWNSTDESNKVYTLTVSGHSGESYKANNIVQADIEVTDTNKTIFEMETKKIWNTDN